MLSKLRVSDIFIVLNPLIYVSRSGILAHILSQHNELIKMAKSDHITMRVDAELHAYLRKMADRESRPLSNMIYLLLSKAVEEDRKNITKRVIS